MSQLHEITTVDEWKDVLQETTEKTTLVFKHSTRCPISTEAYEQVKAYLADEPNKDVHYVLVLVVESRDVSNQIAEDTSVKHESPQVLLIKGQQPVWSASHWDITKQNLQKNVM